MADNDIILNERESRLAVVLFEIMKPQIKQFVEMKALEYEIFWKEQVATTVAKDVRENIMSDLDEKKSSDFDIHDHTGDIEEIVSDWIQYNLTLTTTVD